MQTPKQARETRLTELVETHNIALSLKRLNQARYDTGRRRRALYHAVMMEGSFGNGTLEKIRQALELP